MSLTCHTFLAATAFTANSEGFSGFPWAEVETQPVKKLKQPTLTDVIPNFTQAQVLFRVRDLHKRFGGQKVLNGVSVELAPGQVVLLRGANGCGKTTLLNILTGYLEPDAGAIELFTNGVSQAFHFPKRWWQNLQPGGSFTPERIAQAGICRTWQDVRLFSSQNLRDNLATAAPNQLGENPVAALFCRSNVQQQEQQSLRNSEAMLLELGLAGRENSSADKVSLGQAKRVAIARAIQAGARILFLDEPLAGLDAVGIAEVMQMLHQLAAEHQVTIVIVEHVFNIPHILDLATTVWTLEAGKIRIESPHQVRAELRKISGNSFLSWMQRFAGDNDKIVHQQLPGGAILSTIIPSDCSGSVVLSVEDLVVYRGNRLAIGEADENGCVRGISFKLYKGQPTILQAPNGWGKTTLMEAIAGLIPIHQGTIQLNGQPIEDLQPWERVNLGLSLLQARNNTCLNLSVRETLHLNRIRHIPQHLSNLIGKKISHLSGGEKQKVAMICAVENGQYLLLDEPLSSLDFRELSTCLNRVFEREKDLLFIALPLANFDQSSRKA